MVLNSPGLLRSGVHDSEPLRAALLRAKGVCIPAVRAPPPRGTPGGPPARPVTRPRPAAETQPSHRTGLVLETDRTNVDVRPLCLFLQAVPTATMLSMRAAVPAARCHDVQPALVAMTGSATCLDALRARRRPGAAMQRCTTHCRSEDRQDGLPGCSPRAPPSRLRDAVTHDQLS